mmetsp:Transcript_17771/g.37773  ORF Transcript_17771/g.37773 Transcript_17771/m.37773 type:complete len:336 (-) Transcript_17771:266-1273(-)
MRCAMWRAFHAWVSSHTRILLVRDDGEVQVCGGGIAELRVLEVDDGGHELEADPLLCEVLLRRRDRLHDHKDGDRAFGRHGHILSVSDAASDGAGQLEDIRLLLGGEVLLQRLAQHWLERLGQLERDVRARTDVLLKHRGADEVDGRGLLEQVLPRDRDGLYRLVDRGGPRREHGERGAARLADHIADGPGDGVGLGLTLHLERRVARVGDVDDGGVGHVVGLARALAWRPSAPLVRRGALACAGGGAGGASGANAGGAAAASGGTPRLLGDDVVEAHVNWSGKCGEIAGGGRRSRRGGDEGVTRTRGEASEGDEEGRWWGSDGSIDVVGVSSEV